MAKPGPKPLADHLRRVHRLGVWLNADELAELETRMEQPGLAAAIASGGVSAQRIVKRASEYLRDRALDPRATPAIPAINREAYAALGRVGNDISRIAAAIENRLPDPRERDVLATIVSEIAALRQTLLHLREAPTRLDADDLGDHDDDDDDGGPGLLAD